MEVTFTCTTSKRFILFQRMMLSFYYTCKDIKLISDFVCVDDRSDEKDLKEMKHIFSKINFISNPIGGQLNSIKLLLENIKTEWIFHTEDDWVFLKQDNYIKKMFDIANTDDRIKNVTLRFWECMYIKDNDLEYRMHVYSPMDYKTEWNIIRINDCTYAGLSLNPGLIHVPTLRKCVENISQTDAKDRTWDRTMSMNFWNMGFRRANLINNYVDHTGLIHSQYVEGV